MQVALCNLWKSGMSEINATSTKQIGSSIEIREAKTESVCWIPNERKTIVLIDFDTKFTQIRLDKQHG